MFQLKKSLITTWLALAFLCFPVSATESDCHNPEPLVQIEQVESGECSELENGERDNKKAQLEEDESPSVWAWLWGQRSLPNFHFIDWLEFFTF